MRNTRKGKVAPFTFSLQGDKRDMKQRSYMAFMKTQYIDDRN